MGIWRNFLIALGALFLVIILINTDFSESGRYYDCRDAHWHPDVPVEVKKRCAELFYEEWKRIQDEERARKTLRT